MQSVKNILLNVYNLFGADMRFSQKNRSRIENIYSFKIYYHLCCASFIFNLIVIFLFNMKYQIGKEVVFNFYNFTLLNNILISILFTFYYFIKYGHIEGRRGFFLKQLFFKNIFLTSVLGILNGIIVFLIFLVAAYVVGIAIFHDLDLDHYYIANVIQMILISKILPFASGGIYQALSLTLPYSIHPKKFFRSLK